MPARMTSWPRKKPRHSTTDMTARYAHLSDDRVDRVYDEAIN
ncbi:MAG: hypothetical protein WCA79_02255 [Anaerolineales bacterium]